MTSYKESFSFPFLLLVEAKSQKRHGVRPTIEVNLTAYYKEICRSADIRRFFLSEDWGHAEKFCTLFVYLRTHNRIIADWWFTFTCSFATAWLSSFACWQGNEKLELHVTFAGFWSNFLRFVLKTRYTPYTEKKAIVNLKSTANCMQTFQLCDPEHKNSQNNKIMKHY